MRRAFLAPAIHEFAWASGNRSLEFVLPIFRIGPGSETPSAVSSFRGSVGGLRHGEDSNRSGLYVELHADAAAALAVVEVRTPATPGVGRRWPGAPDRRVPSV